MDFVWMSCILSSDVSLQCLDNGQPAEKDILRRDTVLKMHRDTRMPSSGDVDNAVSRDREDIIIKEEIIDDEYKDYRHDYEDVVTAPKYTNLGLAQKPVNPADLKVSVDDDEGVVVEMYGQNYPIDLSADIESTEYGISASTADAFDAGVSPYSSTRQRLLDYNYGVPINKKKSFKPSKPYARCKKLPRGCRLWEFIRDLLHNPNYNPSHIRWTDISRGEFRLIQTHEIARMWGEKKNNNGMTYEKLSRAMRYYYKRQILAPVIGKRLIYRFGPKSYGWNSRVP